MGLIAFMHDYEFVWLGFFVLQTSEHFVPLPPSPTLLLPSPEFALPVSSALALSRTGERKRKGEKESLPPIFVPLIGVLGSVQPPPTHSLTHPPALSCHVAPDREHCRHLSRSTIPPDHPPLLPLPPPRLFISPFLCPPLRLPFLFTLVRCPIICPRPRTRVSLAPSPSISTMSSLLFHDSRVSNVRNPVPFREATPSSASATTALSSSLAILASRKIFLISSTFRSPPRVYFRIFYGTEKCRGDGVRGEEKEKEGREDLPAFFFSTGAPPLIRLIFLSS